MYVSSFSEINSLAEDSPRLKVADESLSIPFHFRSLARFSEVSKSDISLTMSESFFISF